MRFYVFYLLKTITIISILFYLFISIRAITIGLIHQDANLLDRGLKIFAFLIIISSIAILLFIKNSNFTNTNIFYFIHNSIVIVYKRNKVLNL